MFEQKTKGINFFFTSVIGEKVWGYEKRVGERNDFRNRDNDSPMQYGMIGAAEIPINIKLLISVLFLDAKIFLHFVY